MQINFKICNLEGVFMPIKNKNGNIRCKLCRFVREDPTMKCDNQSVYECGNPESEYYKSFLNVDTQGNVLKYITWSGCEFGQRRVF